ncbi:MFS transporter [Clostridium cylindrosporum]|uniref:Drug resistance transporter, EmrB/QacA subfamily n=1 Tax=Clostridium cylindrosporum DSM 605 TaxID=1121307 RepID=A0A0J8D7K7_CLOCY|nr:MFS transporter [Clostridium cylindrosporum]KMT22015.1 drug resistance transporter, EmrB/QacA subfamily [Clostridium cylindrosporum DSM 605]
MQSLDNTYKKRWSILFILVVLPFMASLDASIVNVALPIMAKKLSVGMASIGWVVTSYLIVISATIIIFGRLGDIKGKTTMFNFGICLFTIGSLLCGISSSISFLVFSRIVQGIGAAAAMANNQGIITEIFPANERGRALGISATFVAIGSMVGSPLGGFIVSFLSWHYIFLINVPVGIITFLLAIKILPKMQRKLDEKLDIKGALLFAIVIVVLFFSIMKGEQLGYDNPIIIAGFVVVIISSIIYVKFEKKTSNPLIELEIFKNKLFSISLFCAFTSYIAIICVNIVQPFYLQDVLKFSPASTGLIMFISPIIVSLIAPISGYISDKVGSESISCLGLFLTTTALVLMSMLNESSSLVTIIIYISVLSIGNGLFQSPNNSLVMSMVPKNKLGIAGSINALVRNLGMVFGASIATALLYSRMSHKIGYKVADYIKGREDVFIYGMRFVYMTTAVICFIGVVFTAYRLYKKRHRNLSNS